MKINYRRKGTEPLIKIKNKKKIKKINRIEIFLMITDFWLCHRFPVSGKYYS